MVRLFRRGDSTEPTRRTVTIAETGREFEVAGKDSILNEALAAGIPFPHSCTVGTCGTCKAKLLSGKVREITDSAIALSADELQAGFILACQSVARKSVTLGVEGLADIPDHDLVATSATVVRQRELTHDIVEIEVELDAPLVYSGGQYAELRLSEISGPRSYSFASAPSPEGRRVTFFVRRVPDGEFTGWLFETSRVGARLDIVGPLGNVWLRPAEVPILCVGGGSGLAPIYAVLEQAAREGCKRDVVLVFGARRQRDLYLTEALQALAAGWSGSFQWIPVLSEEDPASDWSGRRGLVTDVVGELDPALLNACDVYSCGPPVMVDALKALFAEFRSDERFFHADRFVTRVANTAPGI